ncbi:MAG TPA: hypothetical protein VK986_19275 [Tepidisphaeraceae bacterium]|nr:hypothetical protein [Tepidisphaeraceae bacterium]
MPIRLLHRLAPVALAVCLATAVAPLLPAEAAAPRTVNAARPPGDIKLVQRLVADLGDADAAKRDDARVALMGLRTKDLSVLRDAVRRSLPLAPSQRFVLQEIVTQVVLADQTYPTTPGGFLGIRLPSEMAADERSLLGIERGVSVMTRIPGFCSYRLLREGDVIVGIVELPGEPIDSPRQLIAAVLKASAGDTLTFEVVRRAELIRVPITLDAKPDFGGEIPSLNQFENDRAKLAEDTWDRDFAPLFKDADTVG